MNSQIALVTSYASSLQLKSIIAKEIVQLELVVLSEFDRLIYGPNKVGREKPIAFWVCLWTLILSYKSYGIYAKAGIGTPGMNALHLMLLSCTLLLVDSYSFGRG